MTRTAATKQINALRIKLEKGLQSRRTHFAMHLFYIDAYDEMEALARKIVLSIPKGSDDGKT